MSNNAKSNGVRPAVAHDMATSKMSDASAAQHSRNDSERKARPNTILGLFEYAYGEAGRKLNLARKDLDELSVDPNAAQAEIDAVRRLASADPLLAVPQSLLAALAGLGAQTNVLHRVLGLVLTAMASHKLFEGRLGSLAGPAGQPTLTVLEVSNEVQNLTFEELGFSQASDFEGAARERLRVNAVTAFELLLVLGNQLTSEQFVKDMAALVWRAPLQKSAPKAAAAMVSAKNTDALSQLSRHFGAMVQASQKETEAARAQALYQRRLKEQAEALSRTLSADLENEKAHAAELAAQVNELIQRLSAEQSSRVVDKSHHVDDYEILRTQVMRRLTTQVELLSDGLHALRNGSMGVAEEFVDRALNAIDGEINRLKELGGGAQ